MTESTRSSSGTWRPHGLCSMVLLDIASFGDPTRSDEIRGFVRESMYKGVRKSFDDSGIPFTACYSEDRGDGVMVVVPPQYDTAELVDSVLARLRAEVRRHNQLASAAAQLQLRMAVHTGSCHSDENGLVGKALNHAFRLLDAAPLKEALRATQAEIGLIVSERVHEDVVREGRGLIRPEDYRQVEVEVKETATTAWINVPGLAPGGAVAADKAEPVKQPYVPLGSGALIFELVDRMLDIPLMRLERGRDQVVGMLSQEIAGVIPRSPDARSDIYAIIRTCLDYPGGLQQLLTTLRLCVGPSLSLHRLEEAVARLLLQY